MTKLFSKGKETKVCCDHSLYAFFKKHFNPKLHSSTPYDLENIPDYAKQLQQDIEIAEDLPSGDEIKVVIEALKAKKSCSDISSIILNEVINSKSFQAEKTN